MCFGPKGRKRRGGDLAAKSPSYIRKGKVEGRLRHPGLLDEGGRVVGPGGPGRRA